MNSLLAKHIKTEPGKTHAESLAAYEQALVSAKYLLQPIKRMLMERQTELRKVDLKDFNVANHYAMLMFQKGEEQEVALLLSMLPKNLDD